MASPAEETTSVFTVRNHFNERIGKSVGTGGGNADGGAVGNTVDPLLAICSQYVDDSSGGPEGGEGSCPRRNAELRAEPCSNSGSAGSATATEGVRVEQIKRFSEHLILTFESLGGLTTAAAAAAAGGGGGGGIRPLGSSSQVREASISASTFGGVALGGGFRRESAAKQTRVSPQLGPSNDTQSSSPTIASGRTPSTTAPAQAGVERGSSGLAAMLALAGKQVKGRGVSRASGNSGNSVGLKARDNAASSVGFRATASTRGGVLVAGKVVKPEKVLNELFTHWVIHAKNHHEAAKGEATSPAATISSSRSRVLPFDVGHRVTKNGSSSRVGTLQSATQYTGFVQWGQEEGDDIPAEGPLELSDLSLLEPVPLNSDVLIPSGETEPRGSCVVVFQRALQIFDGDKAIAFKLAMAVSCLAAEARKQVRLATASCGPHASPVVRETVRVVTTRGANDMDQAVVQLSYGTFTVPLLEPYYRKLEHLYVPARLSRLNSTASSSRHSIVPEEQKDEFHFRVMTLVMRYYGLAGALGENADQNAGFHASIHPNLALGLQRHLGVDAECFASPLNTGQRFFCSLFPDTDCWFGSLGPFWDFHPTEGSFEVNPPFETHVMLRTAQHLEKLLSAPDAGPLSFFIVLPAWDHGKMDEALLTLKDGPHSKKHALIPAQESTYVDGHQHVLAHSSFIIRSDTHAFLLQNKAGEAKWPPCGFDSAVDMWTNTNRSGGQQQEQQQGGGDAVQSDRGKRGRSPELLQKPSQ